jgi:anti-anti-sigma regulatory factor
MLRITRILEPHSAPTLRLEGKLLEPWIEELLQECTVQGLGPDAIRLDLSAVTFVDAAGATLLRQLIERGAEIVACSGYVAELLQVDKR